MKIPILILMGTLLLAGGTAHAGTSCPRQLSESCPCPEGCSQERCERVCDFAGEDEEGGCNYVCRACLCAPIPTKLDSAAAAHGDSKRVLKKDLVTIRKGELPRPTGILGIRVVSSSGAIKIADVVKGGSGEKAGLLKGDMIVSIGTISARGMSLAETVTLLRGETGSTLRLGVLRGSATVEEVYDIRRSTEPAYFLPSR